MAELVSTESLIERQRPLADNPRAMWELAMDMAASVQPADTPGLFNTVRREGGHVTMAFADHNVALDSIMRGAPGTWYGKAWRSLALPAVHVAQDRTYLYMDEKGGSWLARPPIRRDAEHSYSARDCCMILGTTGLTEAAHTNLPRLSTNQLLSIVRVSQLYAAERRGVPILPEYLSMPRLAEVVSHAKNDEAALLQVANDMCQAKLAATNELSLHALEKFLRRLQRQKAYCALPLLRKRLDPDTSITERGSRARLDRAWRLLHTEDDQVLAINWKGFLVLGEDTNETGSSGLRLMRLVKDITYDSSEGDVSPFVVRAGLAGLISRAGLEIPETFP